MRKIIFILLLLTGFTSCKTYTTVTHEEVLSNIKKINHKWLSKRGFEIVGTVGDWSIYNNPDFCDFIYLSSNKWLRVKYMGSVYNSKGEKLEVE